MAREFGPVTKKHYVALFNKMQRTDPMNHEVFNTKIRDLVLSNGDSIIVMYKLALKVSNPFV